MSKASLRAVLMLSAIGLLLAAGGEKAQGGQESGQALFEQHCAVCHPAGGNIINPEKPLDGKSLAANGLKTPSDIVALMRHPGPGMLTFGPEDLSDEEAHEIAEYVLNSF